MKKLLFLFLIFAILGCGNNDDMPCPTCGYSYPSWQSSSSSFYLSSSSLVISSSSNFYSSSSSLVQSSSSRQSGVIYGEPATLWGEIYETVVIGNQTWIARNLNYNATGSKCYEVEANCAIYGRLYNWSTAMAVCPSGWHLPSSAEWATLINFVGTNAGTKLKAKGGWNSYNGSSGNGTDNYGFAALPGGYGDSGGNFFSVGEDGGWWSSSIGTNASFAYRQGIGYDYGGTYYQYDDKGFLFSVRCLRD